VFLNIPFDQDYEPLFVALISALVSIGRVPHCVLEIPDQGAGRLPRILALIRRFPVSVHDLSRINQPVRFNMPFELGLAVALYHIEKSPKFILLESKKFRLIKTLSDVNGYDPGIHRASAKGVISCILANLGKPSQNPDAQKVLRVHRRLWKIVPKLKRMYGRNDIYSRPVFGDLVDGAILLAKKEGLIAE
jgi:hypothetical protein